ncbi:hypothetical protein ACXWHM_002268 [Enterobacter hormaechei]
MTANKPMTSEQLDELMTVAVNMQRDSEKAGDRPAAMFAYAVQVAALELRNFRNDAAELKQKLIESERYGRQTDITIDNLEMKLAQMAAELASVKQQEPKAWFIRITDEVTVDAREGEKWRGVPLVRVDVETPNHDAFLAEVRASAIEHAASERWGSGYVFDELNNFAAQLRKGVRS